MANNYKRKKYSFIERFNYHKKKTNDFTDKFRYKTEHGVSINFDKFLSALRKNKKMQYSKGYVSYVNDASRGHFKDKSDLAKESISYQKGWKNAKKADEKSRNIKF